MIFASTECARRIDLADCEILIEGAGLAGSHASDAFARPLCGGIASYAGPNAPFNKIAGLGFELLVDAELDAVEREYAARQCPVQVELATLADPAVMRTLVSHAYEPMGFEDVLGFDLSRDVAAGPDIEIRADTDLDEWITLIVDGFTSKDTQGIASHEDFPRDAMERSIRDMVGCSGCTRFTALVDGTPVGAASMRLSSTLAQLTGAATLPSHRRQGVQSALLAHRLRLARHAGAELAVITTLPGSKSGENAHNRGFELLFSRLHLVRQP